MIFFRCSVLYVHMERLVIGVEGVTTSLSHFVSN